MYPYAQTLKIPEQRYLVDKYCFATKEGTDLRIVIFLAIGCQSSIESNIFQSRPMVDLLYFEESE